MFGKMSVGVRRIANTPSSTISDRQHDEGIRALQRQSDDPHLTAKATAGVGSDDYAAGRPCYR